MSYTVKQESFADIAQYANPGNTLAWNLIFTLPQWLAAWWQSFGSGAELHLTAVWLDSKIIGIAPLQLKKQTASFIGSTDVCDYLDFVVVPGMERDFFTALLDDLSKKGIERLDLVSLRPYSAVITGLLPLARERKYEVVCQQKEVSVEMDLPQTWEEYLAMLDSKQRHEVKRKLTRLDKSGVKASYYTLDESNAIYGAMDSFFKLFSESRSDKADFMTPRMDTFFRSMSGAMSQAGLLRLGVLELNRQISAMLMYFDYNGCISLYNSGYNPYYSNLSVGLLSKVFCIRDSIQKGRKKFDFLKGAENYKYYLGGRDVPIHHCQINIMSERKE